MDPVPQIKIDYAQSDIFNPFVPTGNYNPTTNTITLFVNNRQIKDILRTFCHELIHHSQNITNPEEFRRMNINGKLQENDELERLESDAYNRGNILFRKWTETHTH